MNTFIEHHQQAIRFDYSCFDRILLNGVIQVLQNPACVVGFLKQKRQTDRVTPAFFRSISTDYHHFVQALAEKRHVEIIQPPKGVRREEWVEPFYQQLQGRTGIAVILKARENARVAVSFPRQGDHIELLNRFVQQYYFYLQDQDFGRMFLHTLWRAFALGALGVVLRSTGSKATNFTFEDTLSQIGLGYTFLWLLAWRGPKVQIAALVAILVGYWAWFAACELPPAGFDPATVGVPKDWPHWMDGFAAHWNKNANPAHRFDVAFLNAFPRPKPFLFNGGGYLTLSFIPTLGTMILGLLAGQWLRRTELREKSRITGLVVAGIAGLALGIVLDATGICPSVKRIWTPSWVLFSGGWCALLLAAFHALADVGGYRRLVFPLVVVGMNSIFTYVVAHLWDGFFASNLTKHLDTLANWIGGPGTIADGGSFWTLIAGPLAPTAQGVAVLGLIWLCCWWLWKRKVFIRV